MTPWAMLVVPDRDEAREWAERELSNPAYQAAEPTLFDRIALAIGEFFARLLGGAPAGGAMSPVAIVVILVVLAALVGVAFLIWGRPRLERRRRSEASAVVLDDDTRSAADLRAEADALAARGDWDGAVVCRFRALARGLDERGVVRVPPGTTAQALSRRAAEFFPDATGDLGASARIFDDVRYLRHPADAERHATVVRADDRIAASAPARAPRAGELV